MHGFYNNLDKNDTDSAASALSLYAMIVGIIDMIVGLIYMVFYFAVKQTFYIVWRNRPDTKVIYI